MLDLRPIPTEAYVIPSYRTFQSHGQCPVADRPDKRDASVPPTCQHSSMADTSVTRTLRFIGSSHGLEWLPSPNTQSTKTVERRYFLRTGDALPAYTATARATRSDNRVLHTKTLSNTVRTFMHVRTVWILLQQIHARWNQV